MLLKHFSLQLEIVQSSSPVTSVFLAALSREGTSAIDVIVIIIPPMDVCPFPAAFFWWRICSHSVPSDAIQCGVLIFLRFKSYLISPSVYLLVDCGKIFFRYTSTHWILSWWPLASEGNINCSTSSCTHIVVSGMEIIVTSFLGRGRVKQVGTEAFL